MSLPITCRQHSCEWVWFRDGDLGFCPECFPGREEEEVRREESRSRLLSQEPTDRLSKETTWKQCRITWRATPLDRTLAAYRHPRDPGVYRIVVCDAKEPTAGVWLWYRTDTEGVFTLAGKLQAEHIFINPGPWLWRVDYPETE